MIDGHQEHMVIEIGRWAESHPEGGLTSTNLQVALRMSGGVYTRTVRELRRAGLVTVTKGYTGNIPNIRFVSLTERGERVCDLLRQIDSVLKEGTGAV